MTLAGKTVILGSETTKWQIVPAGEGCSSVYVKVSSLHKPSALSMPIN
jgi:hypothetical protein